MGKPQNFGHEKISECYCLMKPFSDSNLDWHILNTVSNSIIFFLRSSMTPECGDPGILAPINFNSELGLWHKFQLRNLRAFVAICWGYLKN